MAKYKCDYSADDMADICLKVRVHKLQRNEEAFARILGITLKTLRECEEAKGNAYKTVFRRLVEKKLIMVQLIIEM